MGTTFVSLNKKGFWIKDGVLEVWLRFLSLHLEDPATENDHKIITPIRNQWLLASRGYFNGCVPISLDEDLQTEKGKEIIVRTIHDFLKTLDTAPEELNKDVLNLMGIEGKFCGDFDTWRLIEVSEAFLDLIEGKIQSDPSETDIFPGSGKEPMKKKTTEQKDGE